MKIEVGKFYKTCSGNKARIYATGCSDGDATFPIHGAILENGSWYIEAWYADGRARNNRVDNDLDSEWVEL